MENNQNLRKKLIIFNGNYFRLIIILLQYIIKEKGKVYMISVA